jgi:hypothetical protein
MQFPREDKSKNIMDIWTKLKKNVSIDVWIRFGCFSITKYSG